MEEKTEIKIEELIKLRTDSEKLKIILDLILNHTRLGYKDKLTINDDDDLMTYLSIVESQKYKKTQNDLLKEKKGDEN